MNDTTPDTPAAAAQPGSAPAHAARGQETTTSTARGQETTTSAAQGQETTRTAPGQETACAAQGRETHTAHDPPADTAATRQQAGPPLAAVDGPAEPTAASAEAGAQRERHHPAEPGASRGRPRPPGPRRPAAIAVEGYRLADVVSGRFDADDAASDLPPPKRVLLPQVETPKLHKVLAQAGLGSRLEMEQLILEGRISVNNEPAHIGQRIQFGDQVKVNGKPIRYRIDPPPARVIAYHKPVGEVVSHDDPHNRPTVFRRLPRLVQGKWQSVGRLDLNTEGLLLLTSSGELANQLMHPRFGLEREYAVRVLGALSNEEKQKLLDGVRLDDGIASFGTIEDGGGEGANCWYRVTIAEGRNREVRRMLEAVGHAVSRLIRIRYGAMVLPRGLKRGTWLELDERDIRALAQAAGARAPALSTRTPTDARAGKQRERSGPPMGNGPRRGRSPQGPAAGARAQNPRRDGGGQGVGAGGNHAGPRAAAQPDPMQTSVGYIGGDSLSRLRQSKRRPAGAGPRRGGGGR
ncbi:pseudouridine synthase [Verminephrobacter eiseniae]|uniref:Pseudouridine synthase n=1 Tax=Verminephrobacter eiseniae (strain EF01-2) TaxID=391735 RepID=A1WE21_VEREI|nr:pseudouridine synthase [Verminephrobacter eiseniae]ABM55878.1 ribosomal large subunit pseudouridine synthase B [Verminephrobacter eiseniae EF01-2]MCW5286259.1 pseudouridine synthase [Verminephrobacter eiseniae]MCW5304558.1 pseudouridine synthase [Verminephrobacter eiseniae]MCW8182029.1 pseudouridine synthase [Verminephrobacter eiseniae]MCW8191987.1 pseudouridine synthase [Verminephrobacter eiseniae]